MCYDVCETLNRRGPGHGVQVTARAGVFFPPPAPTCMHGLHLPSPSPLHFLSLPPITSFWPDEPRGAHTGDSPP